MNGYFKLAMSLDHSISRNGGVIIPIHIWVINEVFDLSYKWVGIKDRCKKHRETHLHRHAERKMKTSTVLTISFVLFLVLATLCRNSEGFALSLTARRDELKRNKKKQASDGVRLRRKLKRLKNKELELERKVSELSKWVQKYKTTHRSKVRIFTPWSSFTVLRALSLYIMFMLATQTLVGSQICYSKFSMTSSKNLNLLYTGFESLRINLLSTKWETLAPLYCTICVKPKF